MRSLQTIQKTFRVFQILAKVAKILCIVGAALCAVGALCAVTARSGGRVFSLFGSPLWFFSEDTDLMQACAEMLAAAVMLTANAVLLAFAGSYLKSELADGTPFTESGAEQLKQLGIRCIYIPIIAVVIAAVIAVSQGVQGIDGIGNLPGIVAGVILILASLIFRYGAELEQKNSAQPERGDI